MTTREGQRHDAELLKERQYVRDAPVLANEAPTVEPDDVDELHFHARSHFCLTIS
jgi:hypothetical protein